MAPLVEDLAAKLAASVVPRRLGLSSGLTRSILTLFTGTALAQGLLVAASPLLTRLYTPEHFGTLGLFLALSSFLAAIIAWRYHLAILLPEGDDEAINLAILSFLLAIGTTGLCVLATIFLRQHIGEPPQFVTPC